jgi:hypothetical protein
MGIGIQEDIAAATAQLIDTIANAFLLDMMTSWLNTLLWL